MPRAFFLFIITVLLLTSCASPLLAPPTPTNTSTPLPTQTPSLTLTPTFTPTPTATHTPIPTETSALPLTEVQSRDKFEELVISGVINCQGSDEGGAEVIVQFMDQATAVGILSNGHLTLGSGIPSAGDPSQCLFLITFQDEKSTIIYKDGETGEFIELPIVE